MLTIKKLLSESADGSSGVPEYLSATQYYIDRKGTERSSAAWFGKGADALGLIGKPVTEALMSKLAQGYSPDGAKLRQNAGAGAKKRPMVDREGKPCLDTKGKPLTSTTGVCLGYDLTWGAPKSVSIAFMAADAALRDKILACHHAAVEKGLAFMEANVLESRRGKGGKDFYASDMVVSRHTHYGARPHEKDWKKRGDHEMDIDVHLHTHALCYNLGRAPDGSWGAIESRLMKDWEKSAGALYRAELAMALSRLGFGIEEDLRLDQDGQVKDRFFKIAGIPDGLADEMSGRRKAILAHQAQFGGTAQQANYATRNSKDEPGFGELMGRWHDDLADYRARHPGLMPTDVRDLLNGKREAVREVDQAKRDRETLDEMHRNKSVWTRSDLTQKVAEQNMGRLDMKGVLKETSAFLIRNELAIIEPEAIHHEDKGKKLSRRHTQVRFADPQVVEQERQIVRAAVERKDEKGVRLDPKVVAKAIDGMEKERGFSLSPEQRAGVEWATFKTGGVCVLQGRAGSGKTTSAEATVKAFRMSGYHLVGCAPSWAASTKLAAETGIETRSIASLVSQLDKGKVKLTSKSVVLVDEAGMVGTEHMAALVRHTSAAKCKLLLQGDVLQIQSVARGNPMESIAASIGSLTLKTIRRQKQASDRDTADAYYAAGHTELRSRRMNQEAGQKILARMDKNGQIHVGQDAHEALNLLIRAYIGDPLPARDKLVMASTRDDVKALNDGIRSALRARGDLGIEHVVNTKNARSGQIQPIALAEKDRIRFTLKSDATELGVVNGTVAVVTGLTPMGDGTFHIQARVESDIKAENGRKLEFQSTEACFEHGFAGTIHKAQSLGVESVFMLGSKGMDRQRSLVGFTRTKQTFGLYVAAADIELHLDASHATDRLQTNALTEGLSKQFGGRTTTQVMADIAKEKALRATEKAVEPVDQTPKVKRLAKASEAIKQASPKVKARQRLAVHTSPDQASLVQRAATAFKTVASKMRQAVLARQREVEQQLAQQRKRTRSMSR